MGQQVSRKILNTSLILLMIFTNCYTRYGFTNTPNLFVLDQTFGACGTSVNGITYGSHGSTPVTNIDVQFFSGTTCSTSIVTQAGNTISWVPVFNHTYKICLNALSAYWSSRAGSTASSMKLIFHSSSSTICTSACLATAVCANGGNCSTGVAGSAVIC